MVSTEKGDEGFTWGVGEIELREIEKLYWLLIQSRFYSNTYEDKVGQFLLIFASCIHSNSCTYSQSNLVDVCCFQDI